MSMPPPDNKTVISIDDAYSQKQIQTMSQYKRVPGIFAFGVCSFYAGFCHNNPEIKLLVHVPEHVRAASSLVSYTCILLSIIFLVYPFLARWKILSTVGDYEKPYAWFKNTPGMILLKLSLISWLAEAPYLAHVMAMMACFLMIFENLVVFLYSKLKSRNVYYNIFFAFYFLCFLLNILFWSITKRTDCSHFFLNWSVYFLLDTMTI